VFVVAATSARTETEAKQAAASLTFLSMFYSHVVLALASSLD
jgi:hypothetical protein